jgi:peptide/nickel transport system ATP-binding protein
MTEDSAATPLVELDDLRVHYDDGGLFGSPPVRAVDGVSLSIRRGETLGLVGESGCGKTTLVRTLVGLETPTGGEVRVDGRPLAARSAAERRAWRGDAGFVSQNPDSSLDDRLAVVEAVREPLDAHGWPTLRVAVEGHDGDLETRGDAVALDDPGGRDADPDILVAVDGGSVLDCGVRDRLPLTAEDFDVAVVAVGGDTLTLRVDLRRSKRRLRRERVRDLLTTVGLTADHARRYPRDLSGGQRQRVAIARALATEPSLLVLDEPFTALDAGVQASVLNLLADLRTELGLTYLLVAHDLRTVRHACDRVAVMYRGELMEVGPTAAVFESPANPYTRSLLSAIPDPDPTVDRRRVPLRGSPPSAREDAPGCPLAARCPVAVRPPAFADLDADLWVRIDDFRAVLRERARAEVTLGDRLRRLLGLGTPLDDIEAVRADRFGDVAVPGTVATHLDTATRLAATGDPAAARDHLRETFGGVCDREHPVLDPLDAGESSRRSRCHRHGDGHEAVDAAFEARR